MSLTQTVFEIADSLSPVIINANRQHFNLFCSIISLEIKKINF